MRVNVVIILNVIFVIGGGYKQRVEINNLHAQILEIVQFIHDPLQIPSIKVPDVHSLGRTVPVFYLLYFFINITILSGYHIIGRVAVTEPVCKNLIHDGSLGPVRRLKSRHNPEGIMLIYLPGNPCLVIIAVDFSGNNLKKITD